MNKFSIQRNRFIAFFVATLLSFVFIKNAQASFATWNMQGSTSQHENLYNLIITPLMSSSNGQPRRVDVFALQEAGAVPESAIQVYSANVIYHGFDINDHPNWRVTEHVYGSYGQDRMRIFHQHLDTNGNRVNNAIVVNDNEVIDHVIVLPSVFPTTRPIMGIIIRSRAYFTFHAFSPGGNDAESAIQNVSNWLNSGSAADLNVSHSIIGGDFNRGPETLTLPFDTRAITTGEPTQRSGLELDWMVALTRSGHTPLETVDAVFFANLDYIYSDHR